MRVLTFEIKQQYVQGVTIDMGTVQGVPIDMGIERRLEYRL